MPQHPNLVLILIDTLRADHVGAYGYARDTTPTLDALAAEGLRFDRAISQSSWTLPSMMSLFTGRHPPELPRGDPDLRRVFALHEAETTLAEHLRAGGYRTISVATNPHNVDEIFSLMQGFDTKRYEASAPADWVVDRAIESLDAVWSADREAPFFLFLHLMDVHEPYSPDPPYDTLFTSDDASRHRVPQGVESPADLADEAVAEHQRNTQALYDGALRFADAEIGRLLTHLQSAGVRDATVIAVASDHGEAFWDSVALERAHRLYSQGQPGRYGVGHGHTVFRELIQVPLILHGPGVPQGVRAEPVRNLDLTPTLLALAGLDPGSSRGDGIDLLSAERASPPALSETDLRSAPQRSLIIGGVQHIRVDEVNLIFDVGHSQWPQLPEAADADADVDAAFGSITRARYRESFLDDGTLSALRALGYIE